MHSIITRLLVVGLLASALAGCGDGVGGSPVDSMRRSLDRYAEYSVILNDMDSKGLFFHDYFHRYRIVYAENGAKGGDGSKPNFAQKMTEWVKVDESLYRKYQDALGMVILAKKPDGSIDAVPQPPLFSYIGDPRFGKWETDGSGNQSWAWLATGMVLSSLIDEVGDAFETRRRVDYRRWNDYKGSRSSGTPYYGKDSQGRPQFGTQGTVTRKSSPGFFERQQTRMSERKDTFAQKVESRMGRSRPSSSSSGGSFSSSRSVSSSRGGSRGRR
ncbi:MAG: hypothetical protein MUF52_03325 [Syntrophobacteraceae bacterium]|jgi:hypothetical protein|nr:hypothetical protein [Syntrophobacteraceae bacterium]